eukprot:1212702-Pleurochrysis_carterae.AAC.1
MALSGGVSIVFIPFGLEMTDNLTGPPSHELPAEHRPHYFVLDDGSVLEVALTVASNGVPFDWEEERFSVPLASQRDIGTQSKTKSLSHAFFLIISVSTEPSRDRRSGEE